MSPEHGGLDGVRPEHGGLAGATPEHGGLTGVRRPEASGLERLVLLPYAAVALLLVYAAPRAFPETADPPWLLAALVVAGALGRAAGPGAGEAPLARWRLQLGLTLGATLVYATLSVWLYPEPAWPPVSEDALTLLVHGYPSLPAVCALVVLAGLTTVPHLVARARALALEAQVASGALCGLGVALCLAWDVERAGAFVLLTTSAFAVLGAGAFHQDRLLGASAPPDERTPRALLGSIALLVAFSLCAAWTCRLAFAPLQDGLNVGTRSPIVEKHLEDLSRALRLARVPGRASVGSLTELPGIDADLAVGFTDGYLFRYAYHRGRWNLFADPADGAGLHYRLRDDAELEVSHRAFERFGH